MIAFASAAFLWVAELRLAHCLVLPLPALIELPHSASFAHHGQRVNRIPNKVFQPVLQFLGVSDDGQSFQLGKATKQSQTT